MTTKEAPEVTFGDPEMRICTIEELAQITGWNVQLLRRAARSGALADKGVIYIPSDANPETGTYMCALKPFLTWFRGEAIAKRTQTQAETAEAVKFVHTLSTVNALLGKVA